MILVTSISPGFCQIYGSFYNRVYKSGDVQISVFEIVKQTGFINGPPVKSLHFVLEIKMADQGLITIQEPIGPEGIIDSGITDLDHDGNIEIYIYWRSDGSANYANLAFFELNGNKVKSHEMFEINRGLKLFFRGNDMLSFKPDSIVRSFPMYVDSDAHCCPSGEVAEIHYKLQNNYLKEAKVIISE